MKTVIFSDTHLTNEFDQKKYDFLRNIIKDSDNIVINGDFWDSWFTTFDDFISSKWSMLFPLLKSKKLYIYMGIMIKRIGAMARLIYSRHSQPNYTF